MKKAYYIVYEQKEDGFSALTVVDPNEVLPNGNNKVVKILIGDYADDILKELTEAKGKEQ
jgi:hypothetical protein